MQAVATSDTTSWMYITALEMWQLIDVREITKYLLHMHQLIMSRCENEAQEAATTNDAAREEQNGREQ